MSSNDAQGKYLLLRHCFMAKPLDLLRTTSFITELIPPYELLQREILGIIGCKMNELEKKKKRISESPNQPTA